ncbi:hypothetical protein AAMO2058_000465300 [Amorphochlora amoebiformis]
MIRSVVTFEGKKVHEKSITVPDGSMSKLSAAVLEMKKDSDVFLTKKIEEIKKKGLQHRNSAKKRRKQ